MIQREPFYQYIELQLREHRRQMARRHSAFFHYPMPHDLDRQGRRVVGQRPALWSAVRGEIATIVIRLGRWLERAPNSGPPVRCSDQR